MTLSNWRHETADIPEHGLVAERHATAEERAAVAAELRLVALDRLTVRYDIRPLDDGRYYLSGDIEAEVVQNCVVTLEPVAARLVERLAVDLWPSAQMPQAASGTLDPLASDDPEPIEDGRIAIGRIVLEHLTTAIDPYPRKADAEFSWTDEPPPPAARPEPAGGPFAALAKWKQKT
ncbi:MAG: YceD family protein [Hyphomicrobiaceae bacterium]